MRLRSGSFWTLIALSLTATAYAEQPSSEVSKLLIQGGKERAEVVIDGSFQVPVYDVDPLDDGKRVVLEVTGAKLKDGGVKVEGSAAVILRSTASTTRPRWWSIRDTMP